MFDVAEQYHLKIVYFICDEKDAKAGDNTGVSFLAMVHFIPRIGEIIRLEDKTRCVVKLIEHAICRIDGEAATFTNIICIKMK